MTAYEKACISNLEKVILEKFKSIKEFSRVTEIKYQTLIEILNLNQHMSFAHFGKMVDALGEDAIDVVFDKEYTQKNILQLNDVEKELIRKIRDDDRIKKAIMGELEKITQYIAHQKTTNPVIDKAIEKEEIMEMLEYIVNLKEIESAISSYYNLAKSAYKDQIEEYEQKKELSTSKKEVS